MARWILAEKIKLIFFLDSHYSVLLIKHLLLKYFLSSIYPTPVLPLNRFTINHENRSSIRNGQNSQAHFHIFILLVNVFLSQMIFLIGFQLNKNICSLEKMLQHNWSYKPVLFSGKICAKTFIFLLVVPWFFTLIFPRGYWILKFLPGFVRLEIKANTWK